MSAAVMRATAPRLTSAVGLLAMLEEQEAQIKAHALTKLNAVVPDFWAEIAESLPDIESLYEDEAFPQRQLAALVASKVYFYLGELKDALEYALGAGSLFNVEEGSDFVESLLSKGIDEYCSLYVKRSEQALASERGSSSDATEVAIDPRLVELVEPVQDLVEGLLVEAVEDRVQGAGEARQRPQLGRPVQSGVGCVVAMG